MEDNKMDLERIVNRNAEAKRNEKSKRYHHKVIVCAIVTVFFFIATIFNLVNPTLGLPVVIVALMNGCYNLGVVKGREDNA
jgi:uncharacterized membrane protein SpoIIM required for sporulation